MTQMATAEAEEGEGPRGMLTKRKTPGQEDTVPPPASGCARARCPALGRVLGTARLTLRLCSPGLRSASA